ncbi:MAG: hypothetical protein IPK74_36570 [Deltaproteobacteria bacterium]|nr:hypothetical protein [Deltaproteobacteria bacterium]
MGGVRVADFGLARIDVDDAEQRALGRFHRELRDVRAGRDRGPGRLARLHGPEQYRTAAVTAAADQFGFCVRCSRRSPARPFDGDSVDTVAAAICAGRARELPPQHAPAHIRAALRRGMAVDDAQRFPTWPRWSPSSSAIRAAPDGAPPRRSVSSVSSPSAAGRPRRGVPTERWTSAEIQPQS